MREFQLDPARTGVVVFDMLEAYRSVIEQAGTVLPVQRLLAGAREAGVAVFWARADHRADGADLAKTLTDTDQQLRPWTSERCPPTRPPHGSGSPGLRVLAELGQHASDYDVPKHRWSAFCGTHLELSLRSAGIDTVLLVGGSTHVGIASTAYAARDMDFQVVVVRDGCHGFTEQRAFFLDKVFPRMCRVRTVDEVLSALLEGKPMTNFAPYDKPEWGSDVMVDVLRGLNLKYVSLNPGSSFRGLHDSLVNYGGDEITMIECPHEKLALGVAHGYAKVTGEPMAVILHDLVGLLHGTMGVYYAYIDRVPVIVLGGSGPAAHERRRPNIDWIHSANVQGQGVRPYTKWDHEPRSLVSVPTVLGRAYRIALEEPRGPVYVALDAALQEDRVGAPVPLDDLPRIASPPSRLAPEPAALQSLAQQLCSASRPVMVLGYPGRDPQSFDVLVQLAEVIGIGAIETHWRLSFPNRHRLNVTGSEALEDADCVLFVDTKDMGKPTQKLESTTRTISSRIADGCRVLDLGFGDIGISSWSEDYAEALPADLRVTADTAVALPLLLELCRGLVAQEAPDRAAQREQRRVDLAVWHGRVWKGWADKAKEVAEQSPVSTARLAAEVWDVVKEHDWVLTAGTAAEWALRTWDFDRPHRHPGKQLGTATQVGISLGVALAHKGTGRLVVDLQPDGDLMFDVGALWVAAAYELPLLTVMFNNRAYYNDWEHQERLARQRGTPVERASIGMAINEPAPDFAQIAQGFGWWAEGPIDDPAAVRDAVQRAADHVLATGKPALVDVVCQFT